MMFKQAYSWFSKSMLLLNLGGRRVAVAGEAGASATAGVASTWLAVRAAIEAKQELSATAAKSNTIS